LPFLTLLLQEKAMYSSTAYFMQLRNDAQQKRIAAASQKHANVWFSISFYFKYLNFQAALSESIHSNPSLSNTQQSEFLDNFQHQVLFFVLFCLNFSFSKTIEWTPRCTFVLSVLLSRLCVRLFLVPGLPLLFCVTKAKTVGIIYANKWDLRLVFYLVICEIGWFFLSEILLGLLIVRKKALKKRIWAYIFESAKNVRVSFMGWKRAIIRIAFLRCQTAN
jgi:hypothetical protein